MNTPASIDSLHFDGISFGYEAQPLLFDGLTFEMMMNCNVFITGRGGGGVSTILKLLAVLIHPNSGHYYLNGRDTTEMTFEEFLPYRLAIGYSFDIGGLFANRTLIENLTLPLVYHKKCSLDEAIEVASKLAVEYGFSRQGDQRPAHVSGGLRKLTCVLRALMLHPQMLVLDDPFSGVGMEAARTLVHSFQERREAGELKHLFLTSRDEIWPQWMGCHTMLIEGGTVRFEERAVAG